MQTVKSHFTAEVGVIILTMQKGFEEARPDSREARKGKENGEAPDAPLG
ncbi:hypothetical protein Q9R34_13165 [Enterobacter sp. BRE11]|nr:hypothetical protein [Enterobacter sp. BRE11]